MREEIKNWWKQAKDDLGKAKILFNNRKYDGAAFFCQQAVEKSLKALSLKKFNKIRRIHDLVELGKDVKLPDDLLDKAKELTQAYIYSRYPDIGRVRNIKGVANNFMKYAGEILKWVKKNL